MWFWRLAASSAFGRRRPGRAGRHARLATGLLLGKAWGLLQTLSSLRKCLHFKRTGILKAFVWRTGRQEKRALQFFPADIITNKT